MADTPEGESVPTTEAEATAHISRMMSEPEQPTEAEPEANPETPVEATEPVEAAPEEQTDESSEEAEPEEVEIPDTIDGLAEVLGVSPEDLSRHLKIGVTVNGEKRDVSLAEARTGHQLDADYRQKTMELAEQRKAVEAERQQESQRLQERVKRLDDVLAVSERILSAEQPDLDRLMEEDPYEYVKAKKRLDDRQAAMQQIVHEKQQLQSEEMQKRQTEQSNYRSEQQRLLSAAVPEVNKPETLKKFETNASEYLKRRGYNDEEVTQAFTLYDHRNIVMLRDAMAFDAMKNGEPVKKLKTLPKVTKPGNVTQKKDTLTASKDRLVRLRKGGSRQQQDAAALEYVKGLL